MESTRNVQFGQLEIGSRTFWLNGRSIIFGVTIGSSKKPPISQVSKDSQQTTSPWVKKPTSLHQARQCSPCHGSDLPQIGVFLGSNGPPMDRKNGTFDLCETHGPGQSLSSNISMTRRTSGRRSLGLNWRLGNSERARDGSSLGVTPHSK